MTTQLVAEANGNRTLGHDKPVSPNSRDDRSPRSTSTMRAADCGGTCRTILGLLTAYPAEYERIMAEADCQPDDLLRIERAFRCGSRRGGGVACPPMEFASINR